MFSVCRCMPNICLCKNLVSVFQYFDLQNILLQKGERRQQHAVKETEFLRLKRSRLDVDDFEPLKVIGRGAFGEVCTLYMQILMLIVF